MTDLTKTFIMTPLLMLLLIAYLFACGNDEPEPTSTPQPTATPTVTPQPTARPTSPPEAITTQYSYRILKTYPHDPDAFTQGLVFLDGIFYEGTGLYGESSLRKVEVESGEVLQLLGLPPEYFGEGIVIWQDKIVQLTWQSRKGFVYDKESFSLLQEFSYPTEGWGITHDGERLIMSDGTATLYFWDPETLQEVGRVTVHNQHGPVANLNELEYIQGDIYANVWKTRTIVIIDPATGWVKGQIDLSGILQGVELPRPVDVLNGIAYDAENDRLFVTGKWWPRIFEIALVSDEVSQ